MKTYHILNGDVLFHLLENIKGEKIVFRECLIEGPIIGKDFNEILTNRIDYFNEIYDVSPEEYKEKSISELMVIKDLGKNTEVNLWFENDLFCQIHFWCSIHFLHPETTCYLVKPIEDSWSGFGKHSYSDLELSLSKKKRIEQEDKNNLSRLWEAFKSSDWEAMRTAAKNLTELIPIIEKVIEAHIDRFPAEGNLGRPEKSLKRIIDKSNDNSFGTIFKAFSEEEGIYGFGDVQVKRLLDKMKDL